MASISRGVFKNFWLLHVDQTLVKIQFDGATVNLISLDLDLLFLRTARVNLVI